MFSSTANASPMFEGKGGEELAFELSNAMEKTINRATIDLESLCVFPGKSCWVLYIDAIVSIQFWKIYYLLL